MTGTHLNGLQGTNPLAFLAALGVQVLFEHEEEQPRLWWSDDIVPHAVIDSEYTVERVADQAMKIFPLWLKSRALNHNLASTSDINLKPKEIERYNGDVKLKPGDMRKYLITVRQQGPGDALAASMIAEGSLAGKGVSKPSDLYFTAANQLILKMAREILERVERDDLLRNLTAPWKYESNLPSLMWDLADDRVYALSASDPANSPTNKKLTNPGAESLAILGMSCHPVFASRDKAGRDRTLTLGCSGGWGKGGAYTWPLWNKPASLYAVRSLIAQATHSDLLSKEGRNRARYYRSWSVARVLRSKIDRSSKGQGFGMFRPPETVWSRE